MAGAHLAIKVQQLNVGSETEDQGLSCVLSTGSARFSTRKAPAAAELFLVTPWELSHAAKKPLHASPSTQHDHSKPLTSPVLTVEVSSAKRWGADAVIATGELLLGPLLDQLQPNGPSLEVPVALARAGGKGGGKLSRSASSAAAAAAAAGSSSTADSALSGGAGAVVLQLSVVTAPPVPKQLLGPVGSGRAEVPPRFCADASWLDWQQPVLHTGAGHVYLAPTVQLMRVTLHKAQGLHNLHVDPQAAAAAAAAIGRMAATGRSPSRAADRAKAVAERAMQDGTRAGRSLLQHTSTWFKRNTAHAGPHQPPRPPSSLVPTSSTSTTPGGAWFPASSDGSAAAAAGTADVPPSSAPTSLPAGGSSDLLQPASTHDAAAAATTGERGPTPRSSFDKPVVSGTGVADTPGGLAAASSATRSLAHSLSGASNSSGSGSSAGQQPLLAPNPHGPVGAVVVAAEHAVEHAAAGVEAAAAGVVHTAEETAVDTLGDLVGKGPGGSLADPVSMLQLATQHTRNSSVDAEAVMAALEENGFHATDAPGGAFFYTRVNLIGVPDVGAGGGGPGGGGSGSSSGAFCSKVVGVSASGEASWEQGFWLPVVRPAPANAVLELELFAAKDDKTRGKSVAVVRAPLSQLLPDDPSGLQAAAAHTHPRPGSTKWHTSRHHKQLPWPLASHVLKASFSDHLHCSFALTVEVADWDLRAELTGAPRAISNAPGAAAEASTAALGAAAAADGVDGSGSAAAVGDGGGAGCPSTTGPPGSSPADSPQRSSATTASPFTAAAGAEAEAGAAAAVAQSSSAGASGGEDVPKQPTPPVGYLDLVVKAFDTHKPLDVFFVLLVDPYCLVSSTSHSTHHHHWGWHLKLPVTDPADTLTLALLAREDQAGGRRRVGAAMLTLFSSSIKLVGKLRVRLSTLPLNTPLNISMPLQGERTNLRPGQPSAATAHLYFNLAVPQLLGRYLPAYAHFSVCSPALYLLSTSPGVAGPDSTLEALATEVQATTARWVEQQPPELPAKVFRKVQDEGRSEFTLSRTRANWRRLMLLRDATAPARDAFSHLCSWSNPLHSCGCYCVILLFGVYPAKVLAVLLLLLTLLLLRKRLQPAAHASAGGAGTAGAAAPSATKHGTKHGTSGGAAGGHAAGAGAGASSSAAGAAAVVVAAGSSGSSGSSSGWQLLLVRPPPAMWDPAYASPDEVQQGSAALPSDPYTSLKQNYEAVISFLTLVQNVIDGWASAGERLQLAFSWTDPLATSVLVVVMLLLALGLWVLGLQVLITAGLLWVFRHPILRTPLPPPPVNFVWSLPTRSDTML